MYLARNMESLLEVGCGVFQQDRRRRFFVRIPYDSPLYHGDPYRFDAKR